MPAPAPNLPMKAKFGPGFAFSTEDDEYQFQFHDLTQLDYRGYTQGGQNPVHDTFVMPRQWWIFSGRLTKPFEYFLVPQFSADTVNLLDAFLNIHYDDRLQFKIGRYKTPFTYEFYNGPINGLINPERSLFFNNFALNRQLGIMAWGQLFQKRLDYAAGIFNGARNGYVNTSDAAAMAAFVNWRPFGDEENTLLENFNIGASVYAGSEINAPLPAVLRTNVATSGNTVVGPAFLAFNANARESGPRAFWSPHVAWYYNHLSLIGEYQAGYQDYAMASSLNNRTRVGVQGFYGQAGYFLTGETVSGRGQVKPLHPFDIRKGKHGTGAIETRRPVQLPRPRQSGLHRRPRRSEQLEQPGLPDRCRRELVLDPVRQDLRRLAARRIRRPGPLRTRQAAAHQRHALGPIPDLLLTRGGPPRRTLAPRRSTGPAIPPRPARDRRGAASRPGREFAEPSGPEGCEPRPDPRPSPSWRGTRNAAGLSNPRDLPETGIMNTTHRGSDRRPAWTRRQVAAACLACAAAGALLSETWKHPAAVADTPAHAPAAASVKAPVEEVLHCALAFAGVHLQKDLPERSAVAYHYCKPVNDDVAQCLLYDGKGPDAKLIGVEYLVSDALFRKLPEDEKSYWHDHEFEVDSGLIRSLTQSGADEKATLAKVRTLHGKIFHTWSSGKDYPRGPARVFWAVTGKDPFTLPDDVKLPPEIKK